MHATVFNRWIVTRRYSSLQILSKNGEIKRKTLLEKMIRTKPNFEKNGCWTRFCAQKADLKESSILESSRIKSSCSNMNLMTYILIFALVIHSHRHLRKLDHHNWARQRLLASAPSLRKLTGKASSTQIFRLL